MEANIKDVQMLFSSNISYRIPQFQRPYAWGREEQWLPLWEDVRTTAERCMSDPSDARAHFMGAIVLQQQDHATGEVEKRIVVDGQQRLTTLQLLAKAVENEFHRREDSQRVDRFRDLLINREHSWGADGESNRAKIRQSNQNDSAAFHHCVTDGSVPPIHRDGAIASAYEYFKQKVGEWLNNADDVEERSNALEKTMFHHLKIVAIDLSSGDKLHVIFETLNTRAEPLLQSDLTKNTVMYKADVIDNGDRAHQLWGTFDDPWWRTEVRDGPIFGARIDRFLNYWMVMSLGREVTSSQVAQAFREYVDNECGRSIGEIATDVREAGKIFRAIDEANVSDPPIQRFLRNVKTIEHRVVIPLILWLLSSNVPGQKVVDCCNLLESYLVRRLLCNYSSRGLNKVMTSLLSQIRRDQPEDVVSFVFAHFDQFTDENQVWPSDRAVEERLRNSPIPANSRKQKMILVELERYFRSEMTETLGPIDDWTVEHIMPKMWQSHWEVPGTSSVEEETETRNKHINFLGNLTLTTSKLNASLSNGPWNEKRDGLKKHSSLMLNHQLLEHAKGDWTENEIRVRSEKLAVAVVKIWPR